MLMDQLLYNTISEGLKFKHKFSRYYDQSEYVFGVFVSVERGHALTKWPYDIHGCVGYYNGNFEALDETFIYNKILDVAFKATQADNRHKYFKTSIYLDVNTTYKIYFMLLNVLRVDSSGMLSNGEPFDN